MFLSVNSRGIHDKIFLEFDLIPFTFQNKFPLQTVPKTTVRKIRVIW